MRKIEADIDRLLEEKTDWEFALGRAMVGKTIHPECNSKDPDLYCIDCDCWKQTRSICG